MIAIEGQFVFTKGKEVLKQFFAILALGAMPFLSARAENTDHVLVAEDVLVLNAVLRPECQSTEGYVLLSSKAASPRAHDDLGEADKSGAFEDLKRRDSSTASVPEGISCAGVRLRDGKEIDRIFGRGVASAGDTPLDATWEKFHEAFPGARGWMTLSLPGYSSDRAIALVYMAHYCGSLCGGGSYVYLRRAEDGWKVIFSFPAWVS